MLRNEIPIYPYDA